MGNFEDLTERKFGKLTVLRRVENKHNQPRWLCQCDCENKTQKIIYGSKLKGGQTKSCGCIGSNKKHGLQNTRIYGIHKGMINRCYNESSADYKDYGGRGVTMCDEWKGSGGFIPFYNWAMENGYTDDLTIDRKDVNGNYEPSNCRWATQKEQQNNRSNNHRLTVNNETKTIAQWSDETGIDRDIIFYRIKAGWSDDKLFIPIVEKNRLEQISGEKYITWSIKRNNWKVVIYDKDTKKHKYVGHYDDIGLAIEARDRYLQSGTIKKEEINKEDFSLYWDKKRKKWKLYVKNSYVGYFKEEKDAIIAKEKYLTTGQIEKTRTSSGVNGISWSKSNSKWYVYTYENKKKNFCWLLYKFK